MILLSAAQAAAQQTALVGARIYDGRERVIENGVVVLRGDRIVAVGEAATTQVPSDAVRVDLQGRTLIPGLINAHGHVGTTVGLRSDPQGYTRENLLRQLRTYAQYGVTTVFSLGDDQAEGFTLRNESGSGALTQARLFVAGPVIGGDTAEAAAAEAERVAAMGPDLLKIRVDDNLGTGKKMPEAAWRAVLNRAQQKKLRVASHIFYLADAKALVRAGSDFVAHSVRDVAVDQEFLQEMKGREACYCPTFTREISTFVYDSTPAWVTDPFFVKGVDSAIVQQLSDPARQAQVRDSPAWKLGQRYKAALETAKQNLKRVSDAGVRVAFGTDTGPPGRFQGFFEHLELEMMVDAGLTPLQALRSATGDAARCHRREAELGVLAPGARADLLVLRANPLENIRNLREIDSVWIGGAKLP